MSRYPLTRIGWGAVRAGDILRFPSTHYSSQGKPWFARAVQNARKTAPFGPGWTLSVFEIEPREDGTFPKPMEWAAADRRTMWGSWTVCEFPYGATRDNNWARIHPALYRVNVVPDPSRDNVSR